MSGECSKTFEQETKRDLSFRQTDLGDRVEREQAGGSGGMETAGAATQDLLNYSSHL